jgi:aerobic carbon-monoxide dehydrogenase small subunit
MSDHAITLIVNRQRHTSTVPSRMLLVHYLREELRLTGTHVGCDTTSCGACTVLLDDRPVKSCTIFAVQADGSRITTIEGLGDPEHPHPLQRGFQEEHGLQCGYCTPGMILAAVPLLHADPPPTDAEIRIGISGNLCRCTGYSNIVRAIRWAIDHPEPEPGPEPERLLS